MGKAQKKTGKGRLDKYYKLAKEQGYRARSAFKLIQLNKKYSFLESARCCIDLCAAPGGWLQVASKYMPVNSVIVGVDLVPIKPIPRVVTFASDITTTTCRNLIRGELKDWKADVVLHDGAPNVGSAWVQDAYSQSELVLMSMKLAAEFLIKGGTFVTKVFRSADYNNLIWVFNQLFGKVEATKPPSSRNVSAEIFVVCRDFLAPKHVDPKFFDPKHVFKDVDAPLPSVGDTVMASKNHQVNIFQPEKKRRHRDGYDEGDYILFRKGSASDFVRSQDPITYLGSVSKIAFETEEEKEWTKMEVTTPDVLTNFEDLKVLGKGDFKTLIKWRTALREEIGLEVKTKPTEELTEVVEIAEEEDPEEAIQNELERLNAEATTKAKRARRRANELRTKTIQRMQLQMTAPLDIGLEQSDAALGLGQDDVFDLDHASRSLRRNGGVINSLGDEEYAESDDDNAEQNDDDDEVLDDVEERERRMQELEQELDGMYDQYQNRLQERDAKYRVKEARAKDKTREEWQGIKRNGADDDDSEESEEEGGWDKVEDAKARAHDDSSDEETDDEDDEPTSTVPERKRRREGENGLSSSKKLKLARVDDTVVKPALSKAAQVWFSQDMFAGANLDDLSDDEDAMSGIEEEAVVEDQDMQSESDDSDGFEEVPAEPEDDGEMWDVDDEDQNEVTQAKIRNHGLITAEAVTIAQQLVNREKTRTQLIDDGFNRYSLNSKEGLPSWFLDEEAKHYKPNLPITKEAVAALRAKMRALDARPIKKVAEAKARKKFKAAQRLEKAMKKAEGVNETSDMTEREKARQIEKLMMKGMATKQKKDIKVVVAKGAHRGIQGRPKGVKGRYVMVDSRMKKELRAKKRKEKATKKRKRN